MKKLLLLFALIFSCHSFSQEILDNQSVIDMIEIGFEEQVIIDKIESSETNFVTTVDELKTLKEKGIMPNVLSSMIKASNQKEEIKKVTFPNNNDKHFFSVDGYSKIVKVDFIISEKVTESFDEEVLRNVIVSLISKARGVIKNKLSYVPKQVYISAKDEDGIYNAGLYFYAKNAYGAEGEESVYYKFSNIKSDNNVVEFDKIEKNNQQKFTFNKVYMNGTKLKMKGSFIFSNDYYEFVLEDDVNQKKTFQNRKSLGDNRWEEISVEMGIKSEMEFNGNDKKYKSDGGTLTTKTMGYTMVYVLNKVAE